MATYPLEPENVIKGLEAFEYRTYKNKILSKRKKNVYENTFN
jgi:hypothetical protein